MLCARVVRGISSTEKEVTPVAAISLRVSRASERTQKSDQDLSAAKKRQIGFAGFVVGAVSEDLRDDIGLRKNCGAVRGNLRALIGVFGVGISCGGPRSGFDGNLEAGFGQIRDYGGNQRDAAFAGIGFAWDTDNHTNAPVESRNRQ